MRCFTVMLLEQKHPGLWVLSCKVRVATPLVAEQVWTAYRITVVLNYTTENSGIMIETCTPAAWRGTRWVCALMSNQTVNSENTVGSFWVVVPCSLSSSKIVSVRHPLRWMCEYIYIWTSCVLTLFAMCERIPSTKVDLILWTWGLQHRVNQWYNFGMLYFCKLYLLT